MCNISNMCTLKKLYTNFEKLIFLFIQYQDDLAHCCYTFLFELYEYDAVLKIVKY